MSGRASTTGGVGDVLRLLRLKHWAKGAFVLIGPFYGMSLTTTPQILAVLGTFLAFGLGSSACYIHNDIQDAESDRNHPRKRHRPIASGRISPKTGYILTAILIILSAGALLLVPSGPTRGYARELAGLCVGLYIANVLIYSSYLKHKVVADVMSLSLGFVLRVVGGCAAVSVEPSGWLLNVTLFLSMFLAFGKRLGERRTMGENASQARQVQIKYTDDLLRMSVVVTGVATLLTYADYVTSQSVHYTRGFNLLWLTLLPATYGLLRAMVKVETGEFDDPTELAFKDRPFQLAVGVFAVLTLGLMLGLRLKLLGPVLA